MSSTPTTPAASRDALLVPVKSFDGAKGRLAPVLSPAARRDLARTMLRRTLQAAGHLVPHVVCGDPDVAAAAKEDGAAVIECLTPGLDIAVTTGVDQLTADGFDHVVVSHGDIPLVHDLDRFINQGAVTIVADRHHQGTNVMSIPTGYDFRWSYGPGSLHRHRAEALRLGLPLHLVTDARLSWDLDEPDDLALASLPADLAEIVSAARPTPTPA